MADLGIDWGQILEVKQTHFTFWVDERWCEDARSHLFHQYRPLLPKYDHFWTFIPVDFSLNVLGRFFFSLKDRPKGKWKVSVFTVIGLVDHSDDV